MIGEHDCGLMNPCAKGHIMRIRRGGERTCYGGGGSNLSIGIGIPSSSTSDFALATFRQIFAIIHEKEHRFCIELCHQRKMNLVKRQLKRRKKKLLR